MESSNRYIKYQVGNETHYISPGGVCMSQQEYGAEYAKFYKYGYDERMAGYYAKFYRYNCTSDMARAYDMGCMDAAASGKCVPDCVIIECAA